MTTETIPASAPTRERTASDVLLAAARYIEEHGWSQDGAWIERDGSACAVGGIQAVTDWDEKGLAVAAENGLCEFLGVVCAESWNDALGRTRDEVLAALRGAAAVR